MHTKNMKQKKIQTVGKYSRDRAVLNNAKSAKRFNQTIIRFSALT